VKLVLGGNFPAMGLYETIFSPGILAVIKGLEAL
jgi:hypothetical protein